ncbi:hypothetical protein AB4Z21_13920 [Paenibacillus sp. MCAF20]
MKTKRTRSLWVVMLSLVMLASMLAACSGNNNKGENEPAPDNKPAATNDAGKETDAPAPDLSPVTYSINTADDKLKWETPINAKITEKTGVSLKYDLTVGDQFQRWDLWLASNDYPDIVVLDAKYTLRYKEAGHQSLQRQASANRRQRHDRLRRLYERLDDEDCVQQPGYLGERLAGPRQLYDRR